MKDDTIVSDSDDEVQERGRVNSMKDHIRDFPVSHNVIAWRKFSHFSKDSPYDGQESYRKSQINRGSSLLLPSRLESNKDEEVSIISDQFSAYDVNGGVPDI